MILTENVLMNYLVKKGLQSPKETRNHAENLSLKCLTGNEEQKKL